MHLQLQDQLLQVRDHIPLEQGLRHSFARQIGRFLRVRDHIPLEQGLRHQVVHRQD